MISALNNTSALRAGFQFNRNQNEQNAVMQRLATGKRINAGKDGPADLISSERLSAEIKALEAETRSFERQQANANIADANVGQLSSLYSELNGLVVSSANSAGLSDAEIAANQQQIDSINSSIQRLTGDAVKSVDTTGLSTTEADALKQQLTDSAAAARSIASGGANNVTNGDLAAAQAAIAQSITDVASARGSIGAFQKNTLAPGIRSNQVAIENLTASRSRIEDADFAVETSNLARTNILTAAGIKTLKIAQQQASTVLSLLSNDD